MDPRWRNFKLERQKKVTGLSVRLHMRVVVRYANGTNDCKVLLKMTRRSLQIFTSGLHAKYAYAVVKSIAIV